MRTYYRGPDAVITSTVFASRTAPQHAIRDLRNVRIHHTEPTRPSAGFALLGLLFIALIGWPLWRASSLYALTLTALMLPGLAALAVFVTRGRRRRRVWELRAIYRGTETTLFRSSDERVFNQVTRALRRAIEDERSTYPASTL